MNVTFSPTNIENVPTLLAQSVLCPMTDRHTHTQKTDNPCPRTELQ